MGIQSSLHILKEVSTISKKYDVIAKITGERFNVFKILDVTTQEVRMHSAFIAELFDVKSPHGCGAAFLICFLEQQKVKFKPGKFLERIGEFSVENCKVKVEHHIGFVNSDKTEGGRIDILLTDSSNAQIILENKINAGDQPQQLVRYNNYNKKAPIFYLTLYGTEPKTNSKGDLKIGEDYVCISYKVDIVNWLEACLKDAVKFPLLRETIQQYIYLIKALTGQTENNKMNTEIATLLTNDSDLFLSAHAIKDALDSTYKILLEKLKIQIQDVAKGLNLGLDCRLNFEKRDSGFDFFHSDLAKDNLRIRFAFGNVRTQNLVVGLAWLKNDSSSKELFSKERIDKYRRITGFKLSHDWWPTFDFFREMRNWNRTEYTYIMTGVMKDIIRNKTIELLDAFRQIDSERYKFE
jgi:hypothetical protein